MAHYNKNILLTSFAFLNSIFSDDFYIFSISLKSLVQIMLIILSYRLLNLYHANISITPISNDDLLIYATLTDSIVIFFVHYSFIYIP